MARHQKWERGEDREREEKSANSEVDTWGDTDIFKAPQSPLMLEK